MTKNIVLFTGHISWMSVKMHLKLNEPFKDENDKPEVSRVMTRSLLPNLTFLWHMRDESWVLEKNDRIYCDIEAERGDGSKSFMRNFSILAAPKTKITKETEKSFEYSAPKETLVGPKDKTRKKQQRQTDKTKKKWKKRN